MKALNYTVFIDKVESGEKRQTIRLVGKHIYGPGDMLFHYTGMRTKNRRLLRKDMCTEVIPIWLSGCMGSVVIDIEDKSPLNLTDRYIFVHVGFPKFVPSKIKTHWITIKEKEKIAAEDGFENIDDFNKFFLKKYDLGEHPTFLTGFQIIKW